MHYQLSADEQQPNTVPFLRMVAPTDIQKVAERMRNIITGYYTGIDVLNFALWRKIGMTSLEGPLVDFLTRMMQWERDNKQSLVRDGSEYFVDYMMQKFAYNANDLADYVKAYLDALEGGMVPPTISEPWDYTPTTTGEDVAKGAAAGVKTLAPLILGIVAVYAAVTVLVPKLILQRT